MKLKITNTWPPKDVNTRFGPKKKFSIKATGHNLGSNEFLGVWLSSATQDWKVGDEVEVVDVVEETGGDGKVYRNVIMPKSSGGLPPEVAKSIEELKSDMVRVKLAIATLEKKVFPATIQGTDIPYPENDLSEDVPF